MSEKAQAKKQVTRVRDYRQVFSSQAGRRVLQDLMASCGMLQTSFTKSDPHETAFKEGQRNAVLRILTIMKVDPDALDKHIEEYENARSST